MAKTVETNKPSAPRTRRTASRQPQDAPDAASAAGISSRDLTAEERASAGNGLDPRLLRRVVVEGLQPEVDAGRCPIKRAVGETVIVEADVHADGHDMLAAALLHRRAGAAGWQEVRMTALGNDRWRAQFTVTELGRYEYTVEGWIDRFASWRHEVSKKFGAGQDVSSELLEGAALVTATVERIRADRGDDSVLARAAAEIADTTVPMGQRVAAALAEDLEAVMSEFADRSQATRYDRVLEVMVERERARTGAWYEMFPRSAGTDPDRSATFDEAARLLPYVASMGFDVLYLPPIHPIGRSFRKGKNNTLNAGPDDVGSPWAIGAEEGGHTAVAPHAATSMSDCRSTIQRTAPF